jgi:hypothetical protein
MSMTLAGFGTVFLGFGGTILLIAMLGLKFGTREHLGGAGRLGMGFVVLGAILFGAGYSVNKKNRQ